MEVAVYLTCPLGCDDDGGVLRVGVLHELVYAWFDHSAAESRGKPASARTICSSSPAARSRLVVDDPVVEVALHGQLLFGGFEAGVDRLGRVGAPALQPAAQVGRVRRRDEDLDRLRHRRAHLLRPLDLDLEDHRVTARETALDLRAQGPVAVAAVGGELEEVLFLGALLELLRGEEVVIATVLLPLPRIARRRRDRELEVRDALQQLGDQASPCRRPTGP